MEKVSIIMPAYNSEVFLSETIQSVICQTYNNWELLIIDDCSTDDSRLIAKQHSKLDPRIKLLVNKTNSGPAITRNYGIQEASGRFIAFLDSDDLWDKEKLSKQINFMISNNYHFTYSYYSQITEQGNFIKNIDNLPNRVSYKSSMKSNKIGCLTAIFDVEFFGKVYMENLKNRQDYTLWLKLLKKEKYAYCFQEILAYYRIRENSISSNKYKLIKYHWIIYRNIEKQSLVKSSYYLLNYVFVKLFK